MGTRCDFYVGDGPEAEYLGSYPFDGYLDGIPAEVKAATNEVDYRQAVAAWLQSEDRATLPEMGWPWPWNTSATTDYAYAWREGALWFSECGHTWRRVSDGEWTQDGYDRSLKDVVFPDMTSRKRVTIGPRSGVIVIAGD